MGDDIMNTLSQEQIAEIRNSVNIVDVISSYVSLVPHGKNYFGVCPFHDDNNPSMSVSPDKQIYKCFSCGATGTVFKFIMDYENVSFPEAVKKVADIGGIKTNIGSIKKIDTGNDLYKIYDLSLKFYMNNINTSFGKEAREYLNKRSINDDIIKEFQIGLSLTSRDELSKILLKNFKDEDVLKSGLVSKSDRGYLDLYYNRIMFPLYNLDGQVVAYSGRIYNKEDNSKYINTRETEIFKKGDLLYNYHRAKGSARLKNQIIVMEGFMDVIRAYTIGVTNVVATMGTAVTKTQANLIKRMGKQVILCFDGDEAGAKATMACSNELIDIGVIPDVIRLEEDLDPDDYIKKYGKDAFLTKLEHPISMMEFKLNYLKKGKNLTDPFGTTNYIKDVISEINKIDDDILKEVTIKKVSLETGVSEDVLRNHLTSNEKVKPVLKNDNVFKSKYEKAESSLIYFMLKKPEAIELYDKKITFMPTQKFRYLARDISNYYQKYKSISEAEFIDYVQCDPEVLQVIKEVNLENNNDECTSDEILDYINVIKDYNVQNEIKRLKIKISEVTDPLKQASIANKIIDLKKGV